MSKPRKNAPAPASISEKPEGEGREFARTFGEPMFQAMMSVGRLMGERFQGTGDLRGIVDALRDEVRAVQGGKLAGQEAMLVSQARTLDVLFHRLLQQALLNMGEHLDATDTYMRLALRAQSQARATIETLGELKHPRSVAFVGQANIAHGPQQVNNGLPPVQADAPRAGTTESPPRQLLEAQQHGEWMDTRAAGATAPGDTALAPVGTINGPTDTRGTRKVRGRKVQGRRPADDA